MSNWQHRAKANLKATVKFVEEFGETLNLKVRQNPAPENLTKSSNWEQRVKEGLENTARFVHENREGLGLPAASALTMSILALANQTMFTDNNAELAALQAASDQRGQMESQLADNHFTNGNVVTAHNERPGNQGQMNDSLDNDPGEGDEPDFEPT